jgi:hypothetical protein
LTVREAAREVGISKAKCHEILTFAVGTAWSLLFALPRHIVTPLSENSSPPCQPLSVHYYTTSELPKTYCCAARKSEELNS